MKTPWSTLLQYGTGIATILVLTIAGIALLLVVGAAVLITKAMVFIE